MANQSRSLTGEKLKADLKVQEAEMNNYPSNNFSTVFFLVILFIGMGVLIYHASEITQENGQLKETVSTLQTNETALNKENVALKTENSTLIKENTTLKMGNTTLNAENITLKTENATLEEENATLKTENAAITSENSMLKAELVSEVSKNIFLDTSDAEKIAELEKLRSENNNLSMENLQLKTIGNNGNGINQREVENLRSTILPIAVILITSFNIYGLFNNVRRKKTVSFLGMKNLAGKRQNPHIIESRFIER